jgi:hypothetical protein
VKKLAFVGNGEPPGKLLEIFRKQTPGRSGVWGQLEGIDNYQNADYFMVIDDLPGNLKGVDVSKCVFLGTHPETLKAYRNTSHYKCLARTDVKDHVGMLEWWIHFDYDYLKALQPPVKTKQLGAIVSDSNGDRSHTLRRDWLSRFTAKSNLNFDLHGRIVPFTPGMKKYYHGACGSWDPRGAAASGGNDHMSGKEQVYLEHKYMLEFDNIGKNYFSERVLDCMLLWSMPLYWGGNLHSYLPENSFRYIDINDDGADAQNIANSDFYEKHIDDLTKARELLLDHLQLWPRTHHLIYGANK